VKKRPLITLGVVYAAFLVVGLIVMSRNRTFALFDTAGTIASQEKGLILFTVLLGGTIVIPVLVMTFAIAWHYREGNTKAVYRPEWSGNRLAESIWWLIPTVIIAMVGVVIWQSSHALDPYKTLTSTKPAINVQVVALDWRWLFIYPDAGIATLSYLKIPAGSPVNFEITSDAPMNSFWIPRLSGQIYAMSGMSTRLSVEADHPGDYKGQSANLSGAGFAGMEFVASSVSQPDFNTWVLESQKTGAMLTRASYDGLSHPSQDASRQTFKLMDNNLYNEIIDKYMAPPSSSKSPAAPMKNMNMGAM
jgi:cytochrome o ubiquinol oxidase subunit 2